MISKLRFTLKVYIHLHNFWLLYNSIAQHSNVDVYDRISCLSASLFVNTITSELLNIGWWDLMGRCIAQKSQPSLNFSVTGPIFGVHTPKMWQIDHFAKSKQTDGWAWQWNISACCLVITRFYLLFTTLMQQKQPSFLLSSPPNPLLTTRH